MACGFSHIHCVVREKHVLTQQHTIIIIHKILETCVIYLAATLLTGVNGAIPFKQHAHSPYIISQAWPEFHWCECPYEGTK